METLPAVMLALALLACPGAASAAMALQGPAHVVDGDTIVVGDRPLNQGYSALNASCASSGALMPQVAGERVRLFGLDAPEKAQICQDKHGKGYQCGEGHPASYHCTATGCHCNGQDRTCCDEL